MSLTRRLLLRWFRVRLGRRRLFKLKQLLDVADAFGILRPPLFYEGRRNVVIRRSAEGKSNDRSLDDRDVVRFLAVKRQDLFCHLPPTPAAQVVDREIGDIALVEQ